jgi:signal peptidase
MAAKHAARSERKASRRRLRSRSWFVLSLLTVTAVVACLAAVMAMVFVPMALGWNGVVVLSGSMEPTLHTGGIAFVQPATAEEIAVGDVMTFRQSSGRRTNLVTHRVIGSALTENGLEFTTKGDANTDPDLNPVPASAVVGKVRFNLPYVGTAIETLRNRDNYYVFIGIPAALLILNEIFTVASEFRREQAKRRARLTGTEGAAS